MRYLLLMLFMVASLARAEIDPTEYEVCITQANAAHTIAEYRDLGASEKEVNQLILRVARKGDTTQLMLDYSRIVYINPDTTPDQFYRYVLQTCLHRPI